MDDASVNGAVASLVLCSVPGQDRALTELRRVMRPGGGLRFYEHVISDCHPKRLLLQAVDCSGLWPRIAGGCHPARDTAAVIERTGFEIQRSKRIMFAPRARSRRSRTSSAAPAAADVQFGGLAPLDSAAVAPDDPDVQAASSPATLQALLDAAAARIARLEPTGALTAIQAGGVLIDIRSEPDRERDGIVPGSLHIPRTVLEWRLAPDSSWRSPHVGGLEQQIILICDHGCSSILAAATLVDLGFTRACDVIGGFAAWRDAGLPTVPARATDRAPGEPPGMRGPDD